MEKLPPRWCWSLAYCSEEEEVGFANVICVEGYSCDVIGDQWPVLCQVQEEEDEGGEGGGEQGEGGRVPPHGIVPNGSSPGRCYAAFGGRRKYQPSQGNVK